MNTDILDKTIVYINSSNAFYNNNTDFDINFSMAEPIKNAVYVMISKIEVLLNPSVSINGLAIEDGDSIFVVVKNYERVHTNIAGNNVKCFDQITLNLSDKFGSSAIPNQNILFRSEYGSTVCDVNDINTYVLNPVDPSLKRFDIRLYDKNFKIIPKNIIKKFVMVLCVYHSRKKLTQF